MLLLSLVAVLAWLVPAPAFAVTASGRVVMGTRGAALPGDLRVTVLQNTPEGEPQGQPTFVPVAPDGTFNFEADPARGHLIGLFYLGAAYSRVLEPGETGGIELEIYETTTDASVVKVASDSMTILQSETEGQSDVLEVLQILRFQNDSDRAYVGSDPEQPAEAAPEGSPPPRRVLRLPLPESAFDLAPADPGNGAGLATAGGRLVTTSPLVPGDTSVAYLFKVKVPRSGWQLRREIYHPTDHSDLLVGKRLRLAAAPGFDFAESKTLGGQEYNRYRSGSRNPGAVLEADIAFAGSGTSNGVWIGFGIVAALLAALLVSGTLRLRRRRTVDKAASAGREPGKDPKPAPTREQLIKQVAALDEEFDAGGLDQQTYDARRSTLLARLGKAAGNP